MIADKSKNISIKIDFINNFLFSNTKKIYVSRIYNLPEFYLYLLSAFEKYKKYEQKCICQEKKKKKTKIK